MQIPERYYLLLNKIYFKKSELKVACYETKFYALTIVLIDSDINYMNKNKEKWNIDLK